MRKLNLGVGIALASLFAVGAARADLMFAFDQPSYTVDVGSPVSVQVFLAQTPPTTILSLEGLFSTGVAVDFNSSVVSLTNITPNPQFDDVAVFFPPGGFTDNVLDPVAPVFPPTGGNQILLGTFTFTGLASGLTTLTARDLFPGGSEENLTGQGTPLDSLILNGTANFTVTGQPGSVIPEPSTLTLLGIGLGALLGYWWRLHKTSRDRALATGRKP